jgi:hypothetical protein
LLTPVEAEAVWTKNTFELDHVRVYKLCRIRADRSFFFLGGLVVVLYATPYVIQLTI